MIGLARHNDLGEIDSRLATSEDDGSGSTSTAAPQEFINVCQTAWGLALTHLDTYIAPMHMTTKSAVVMTKLAHNFLVASKDLHEVEVSRLLESANVDAASQPARPYQ